MRARAFGWFLAASVACGGGGGGSQDPGIAPPSGALAEARTLAEAGRLDEALQRAQGAPRDADSLYEQGRIWALKAAQAPLPTAAPPASPAAARAGPAPRPEFKEEELRAADLFEQALRERPGHPQAALALAELLAPHAIRRHDHEREAARRRRGRAAARETPVPDAAGAIDWSADRVLRLFQQAMRADPAARPPVDAYIAYALRVGQLEAAEAGFQELTRRVKESAEPYVLYGDFLLDQKKDDVAAVEQYRQALIWNAGDGTTRRKLAEIYLGRGAAHYRRQQFALAEAQFGEAAKYVSQGSEQETRLRDYQDRLDQLRR